MVSQHHHLAGGGHQGPVHLRLEQIWGGEASLRIHAMNAKEQYVQVQAAHRCGGDGAHQGVRRRALAAGENHGRSGAGALEDVGDPRGIRHHRQVRVVADGLGKRPCGGSGADADGHAVADKGKCLIGDRLLFQGELR